MLRTWSRLLLVGALVAAVAAAATADAVAQASEAQMRKVIAMLDERGKEIPLDQAVTDALGLTKGGTKISPRQIAVQDDEGLIHAFIRLDKGAGYLLGRVAEAGVLVIHASADWRLMGAIVKMPGGKATVTLAGPDAQQRLEEELRQWAKIADEL
ncbi:MAG: hypothetical protein ACM3O6_14150 [Acidobacteriota bacterium]|jgi:lipopolysaccharide export LptBFGC system permease protein LptF